MPFGKHIGASKWAGPGVAIAAALLAGCTATHQTVAVKESSLVSRDTLACGVALTELVDSVGPRVFQGSSGHTYQLTGLTNLVREQVESWHPAGERADHDILLSLELVRAYPQLKTWQTYFHTVFLATTPAVESKVIRGSHHVSNWWGSQAEFMQTVETSLDDALGNLHEWLAQQCQSDRTDQPSSPVSAGKAD